MKSQSREINETDKPQVPTGPASNRCLGILYVFTHPESPRPRRSDQVRCPCQVLADHPEFDAKRAAKSVPRRLALKPVCVNAFGSLHRPIDFRIDWLRIGENGSETGQIGVADAKGPALTKARLIPRVSRAGGKPRVVRLVRRQIHSIRSGPTGRYELMSTPVEVVFVLARASSCGPAPSEKKRLP